MLEEAKNEPYHGIRRITKAVGKQKMEKKQSVKGWE